MKQDRGIEAELCFHPVPGNTVHALSNSAYENENLTLKLREDIKGSRVDKITGKVKMWGILQLVDGRLCWCTFCGKKGRGGLRLMTTTRQLGGTGLQTAWWIMWLDNLSTWQSNSIWLGGRGGGDRFH